MPNTPQLTPQENSVLTLFSSLAPEFRTEKWKNWEAVCRTMSEFTRGCLQHIVGEEVIAPQDRVTVQPKHREMGNWFLRTGSEKKV